MPETKTCPTCKGEGYINALVSQHDDEKVRVKYPTCNGKGVRHHMTEEEERDYHADYW